MADTYTSQGFTKPEPGGSLNTWGQKLNVVIDMLAAQNKFSEVQVSGATSVSFTNASASATALPTGLKLTANGVTGAFAFTLPAGVPYKWLIWNMTGYTASINAGGATTISLETGHSVMVAYSDDDGDIAVVTPSVFRAGLVANGIISGVTAGTLGTHAVNLTQMQAAISVLSTAQTGLVLNSATAIAAEYFEDVITVSGSLVKSKVNAGTATEATNIAFTFDEGAAVLNAGVLAV